MRLFVALPLDPEMRAAVLAAVPPASPGTRPVEERDLHVTLHFLGDRELAATRAALRKVRVGPFEAVVEGTGTFVGRDGDVIGWAGVEASPKLLALHAAVAEALAPLGFVPEGRPYHPHLTLFRTRAGSPVPTLPPVPRTTGWVHEVALFSSELGPAGPIYRRIATVGLRSPEGWARDPALAAVPVEARWRVLEERLASDDEMVMREAVYLLSELRSRRALERRSALARIGPELRQLWVLTAGLGSEDGDDVRVEVYRSPETSDLIRDIAIDNLDLYSSRRSARFARALAAAADAAVGDPCPEVRWTACFKLAQSRTRRAEEPLRRAAADPAVSRFGAVAEVAEVALKHLRSRGRHPLVAGYQIELERREAEAAGSGDPVDSGATP